jgi:tetratricopeptide (TPR) repeat protein
MGSLLALDGKYPQAQNYFEKALTQPCSHPKLWRSQVYRKLCDAFTAQYQHARAHAALDQAEEALHYSARDGTSAEKAEWIQIHLAHIQLCYWENLPDRMEELIHKVSPSVEAVGRIDQKITLLSTQYQVRLRRERYRLSAETVEMVHRRLKLTESLADPSALAVAQFQYGFSLLWQGDISAAREWLSTGYAATARIGARLWQLRCLTYLSIANRKLHDLAPLREQTRDLLELATTINEPTYHGIGLANQGWLAWQDGDPARASQLCIGAIEIWGQFGGDVFHGLAYWVLLAVAVAKHDLKQAAEYTRSLLDPDPMYRPVEEAIAILLSQALNACQAQDPQTAFTLFNQALEKARNAGEL